jgi:hypothetical protein
MIYCDLSPIQIDLLDIKNDLIDDFKNKIKDYIPVRDYKQDMDRIDIDSNFKELNEKYLPEQMRCNFKVYDVAKHLETEIRSRFKYLANLLDNAYVRYQLVSGKGVLLPHRDEVRKSGIIILLSGEGGISDFFDDDSDSIFPNYRSMKLAHTCIMKIGENWIYNHQAIHSLRDNRPPRIAISLGWDDITAQELYEYHKK